ncbi:serine hydrolase domain-containing protein [Heyndrickxia sp. FSL W8-0423]|uniref:serine hydrolase domain-containing protein n=1 Tax=Heyndrickxia sp. FSL W8-0423 TaxID=2921601 RepID=UPI0030F757B2
MDWRLFEEKLSKRMEADHIPGAAIAVSKNGEVIYQKGFGVKDLESMELVTPKTIFGIASVTKSFTALAIMKLEEAGKLSIDDPVIKYLPEFRISNIDSMESIKIHHLLTHTTGLAPIRRREELNKFHEHLTYLAENEHSLLGKPGEYLSYCNDTFLLLGVIIERLTGRIYRRYITEELLNPLHMNRSTFSIEEINKMDDVSSPYVYYQETEQFEKQNWPALGNYEVGGGIRSNVLDLLKYGELYVNQGLIDKDTFISKKQLEKMQNPYFQINRNSYYGYALQVTLDYHGFTLVDHGGGQPGVSSNFGFIPEQKLVVAVLTNASDVPAKDIWLEVVNTALGLPIEGKYSHLEPTVELPDARKKQFVGTYQSEEGTSIQILLKGSVLQAKIDNQVFTLRACDKTTLVIMKTEKQIRFYFNQNEEPWAAFFGLRMLLKTSGN